MPRIKGLNLFGTYATMDSKYEGKGIAAWFFENCFLLSKHAGVKGYYGRITSEASR